MSTGEAVWWDMKTWSWLISLVVVNSLLNTQGDLIQYDSRASRSGFIRLPRIEPHKIVRDILLTFPTPLTPTHLEHVFVIPLQVTLNRAN